MSMYFEELDFQSTPIGDLSLRRRREMRTGEDVFEIKLGEAFLMSSMFTASEIALADLAIADVSVDSANIVIGGLGLGYTAKAALAHRRVGTLLVVDALKTVIDWHETGKLPLGTELTADPRCSFIHGDFFALAHSSSGFDPSHPGRLFDAILVDIDHSPEFLLDPKNAAFYQIDGLERLAKHLTPGGIFAVWSNEWPDEEFTARLACVFSQARSEPVTFYNPLQERDFTQTVYVAQTAPAKGL